MIKKLRLTLLLIISIVGCNAYSQYTDIINSNRPGESFGAYSVGNTIFQVEGGLSYIYEENKNTSIIAKGLFSDLDVRYGFWREELEFIASLQYQNDRYRYPDALSTRRSFLKETNFGLKYLVYDPFKGMEEEQEIRSWKTRNKFKWKQFIPAIAVYAGFNLNSSANPYVPEDQSTWTPKFMIALQNHFSGGWVFVTNLMINHFGSKKYQTLGGILTAVKSFNARWSGFTEIQGYKNKYYKDIILRGGAAYLYDENLQFDISLSKNFNNNTNIIYGGIGVSWRFTLNYQDLRIYKTNEPEENPFSGGGGGQEENPDQENEDENSDENTDEEGIIDEDTDFDNEENGEESDSNENSISDDENESDTNNDEE